MKMLYKFLILDYCTLYFSGGGDSSSSSSAATTTSNIDKRQVVSSGAVGVTTDAAGGISVTNNALDAGAIQGALDYVKATDATQGANFTSLLSLADKMFSTGAGVIAKAQDTTLAQIGQINTAKNDTTGTIDQKTMIILAAASLGVLALTKKG